MTRQNLSPNPACGANVTGWSGNGSAPARITGQTGFPVSTAAQYSSGNFILTPRAALVPGGQYTMSVYAKPSVDYFFKTAYLGVSHTVGGDTFPDSWSVSLPQGVATRVSRTFTAPGDAVAAWFVVDVVVAIADLRCTGHLCEGGATLDTYFDGGFPNATWDGTPHNSTSTLLDVIDPVIHPHPAQRVVASLDRTVGYPAEGSIRATIESL